MESCTNLTDYFMLFNISSAEAKSLSDGTILYSLELWDCREVRYLSGKSASLALNPLTEEPRLKFSKGDPFRGTPHIHTIINEQHYQDLLKNRETLFTTSYGDIYIGLLHQNN